MKTTLYFVAYGLMIFSTLCCNNPRPQMPDKQLSSEKLAAKQLSDEQIIILIKSFYTSYITEVAEGKLPNSEVKLDSMRQHNCTAVLLRRIDTLDYDPLLKAQDAKISELKTLTVEKDPQQRNWYSVSFIDTYDGAKRIIRVKILKENDVYKIDSLK